MITMSPKLVGGHGEAMWAHCNGLNRAACTAASPSSQTWSGLIQIWCIIFYLFSFFFCELKILTIFCQRCKRKIDQTCLSKIWKEVEACKSKCRRLHALTTVLQSSFDPQVLQQLHPSCLCSSNSHPKKEKHKM